VIALALALLVAVLARWLRGTGREPQALLALGVALALTVPLAYAWGPVVASAVLAWPLERRRRAIERDRMLVAAHLATAQAGATERAAAPVVDDPIARRALEVLALREAELAASLARSAPPAPEPGPLPGVRARFMAAMGHELRSPLNSISGFAQLLEDGSDGPLNDAQRENVVLVRRAAGELLTLLTDILDTARIEAGRVRLDRQWTAPVEVLTLALERLRTQSELEANIEAQVQPGLSPLYVDRARLGQALVNVMRAVPRERKLHVRVRESRERDRPAVRFELHDRTKPITEAEALRAFDPDPAARPEGRSLALGLALSVARDLAQLHGGDARAESLDGGTNWIVWVPAESDVEPPPPARRSPRPPRQR